MGRRQAGCRRPILLLPLTALLVLAACAEQSNVDPAASVTVRGSVRDSDGSPLAARPVRLGSGVTVLEGGAGVLTLGLFCVEDACSGDSFDTTTSDDGMFSFDLAGSDTRSAFGEATSFLLSTSASPPSDSPAGPAISARFRIQTTDVVLPDLDLVDPAPQLGAVDGSVVVGWDGAVAPGPYVISFADRTGDAVWEAAEAAAAFRVDGRVLEDSSGQVTVAGSRADAIEGSDVMIDWRSSSVAFRGGSGAPPSRGAACELHAGDGTVQPLPECGLTDGSFRPAALPISVCPDQQPEPAAGCRPVERVRVRLPSPVPADLLVVRGCTDPCRAATVPEAGTEPTDAGPVSGAFGTVALDGSSVVAVDITTADAASLTELSVWSPVPDRPALLPIDEPAGFGAASDDGESRRWWVIVAIGLVLVTGLALGVVIGRRSRSAPR